MTAANPPGLPGPLRLTPSFPFVGGARYVIERKFADQLDLDSAGVKALEEINADEGVRWLYSFLSADQRQTYCLYEAPSPDELIAAARRAGIPADVIVEVTQVSPEMVT
jgi:hypothetical protein